VPLRTRLVIILVLLVAAALAVIEPITYTTTRSSLISKVDAQMASSVSTWEQYFLFALGRAPQPPSFELIQPDTVAALYLANGALVPTSVGDPIWPCRSCRAFPVLPHRYVQHLAASTPSFGRNPTNFFSTFAGTHGAQSFRVVATVFPGGDEGNLVLIVAFPLTGVDSTMGHLLALELLIGLSVLVAVAVVAWFLVRLGLRPLERMATTASEIAAGDLTRRVEDTDEHTEVGQLGNALNVMLSQIERAFKEREASEQQLRRFVGDASHELRTPLTSIRGYAELFKSGAAEHPEDLAAALGRIESESARMGGLVDDLLLLARLDQGRPLRHDRVDLTELASDAVQDASVVDPSRSIRLIGTGPSFVIGDEQRLRQVLGNLVTNAMAYSPPGSPIEVAVHKDRAAAEATAAPAAAFADRARSAVVAAGLVAQPGRPLGPTDLSAPATATPFGAVDSAPLVTEPGGPANVPDGLIGGPHKPGRFEPPRAPVDPASPPPWVGPRAAIAVIDHGPGIPVEDVAHVFERFWRADRSRKRTSGGSGLGLSIVAAVVSAHGGRVTIRQTPGGGATFVVELPAAVSNGSSPEAPGE
jgi:two-component system OmpR family sensor kinase